MEALQGLKGFRSGSPAAVFARLKPRERPRPAIITDASGVGDAVVWFRAAGSQPWALVPMTAGDSDRYTGTIPGSATAGATVEYYIEATDTSPAENTAVDPSGAPDEVYVVDVLPSGANNGTNNGGTNNATNNGDNNGGNGAAGSSADDGCGCSAVGGSAPSAWWFVIVGVVVAWGLRRRQR